MTSPHALVVGGSSDIGRAISVVLAREGYELTLWGRDQGRLSHTARLCEASGQRCTADVIDVTDRAATRQGLTGYWAGGS